MTLDSDDIRLMRIFAGFPGKGSSYKSGVIENVFFSRFRTLRIRHLLGNEANIVISLDAFPVTPKCVTLNDFAWLFEWPFYFMCSLLRTATGSLFVAYLLSFVYYT